MEAQLPFEREARRQAREVGCSTISKDNSTNFVVLLPTGAHRLLRLGVRVDAHVAARGQRLDGNDLELWQQDGRVALDRAVREPLELELRRHVRVWRSID